MMKKDDRFTVTRLAKVFGGNRFTLSQMHRALMPKRSAAWIPFDQDSLRHDMRRLVVLGVVEEAQGPRGGEGWKLRPGAEKFAF